MTTSRNARIARTAAAFLTALLLIGCGFAVRNVDMIDLPDGHWTVERAVVSGSTGDLVKIADFEPAESDAAARAHAESLGLAVD